jgi:HEAT repeat protein
LLLEASDPDQVESQLVKDPQAVDDLAGLLHDPDARVQLAAVQVITRLTAVGSSLSEKLIDSKQGVLCQLTAMLSGGTTLATAAAKAMCWIILPICSRGYQEKVICQAGLVAGLVAALDRGNDELLRAALGGLYWLGSSVGQHPALLEGRPSLVSLLQQADLIIAWRVAHLLACIANYHPDQFAAEPGLFGHLVALLQPGDQAPWRCSASLEVLEAVCKSSVRNVCKLAAEPGVISNLVAVLAQSHSDTAPLAESFSQSAQIAARIVWLLLQLVKNVRSCLETLSTQPDIMQRISRVAHCPLNGPAACELMDLLASSSSSQQAALNRLSDSQSVDDAVGYTTAPATKLSFGAPEGGEPNTTDTHYSGVVQATTLAGTLLGLAAGAAATSSNGSSSRSSGGLGASSYRTLNPLFAEEKSTHRDSSSADEQDARGNISSPLTGVVPKAGTQDACSTGQRSAGAADSDSSSSEPVELTEEDEALLIKCLSEAFAKDGAFELLKQLKHSHPASVKTAALQLLLKTSDPYEAGSQLSKDPQAVDILAGLLRDPDARVQLAAVQVIGELTSMVCQFDTLSENLIHSKQDVLQQLIAMLSRGTTLATAAAKAIYEIMRDTQFRGGPEKAIRQAGLVAGLVAALGKGTMMSCCMQPSWPWNNWGPALVSTQTCWRRQPAGLLEEGSFRRWCAFCNIQTRATQKTQHCSWLKCPTTTRSQQCQAFSETS